MLMACRKTPLLLFGFLVITAGLAASGDHPEGFWILENTDPDTPFGGLKLNKKDQFELLIYDDKCQLYTVDGSIRQRSPGRWELKNTVDYSNTFLMTQEDQKLKLVDTEDQTMVFFATSQSQLERAIKEHCKKNNKTKKINE